MSTDSLELDGVRLGRAPGEREMNPDRKTTIELSVHAYEEKGDGHIDNPKIGTIFDSLDEAYKFYNLYSWKIGFVIRLAKSWLNVNRTRCMQEIVCACAGTPLKENRRSSRCGCSAMIRLLRSKDVAWYTSEHKVGHNHPLCVTCGQKMHWKSHRHIDQYPKDLVKQLKDNNVGFGKVFSIVGSFVEAAENVPFTKRVITHKCSGSQQSSMEVFYPNLLIRHKGSQIIFICLRS